MRSSCHDLYGDEHWIFFNNYSCYRTLDLPAMAVAQSLLLKKPEETSILLVNNITCTSLFFLCQYHSNYFHSYFLPFCSHASMHGQFLFLSASSSFHSSVFLRWSISTNDLLFYSCCHFNEWMFSRFSITL